MLRHGDIDQRHFHAFSTGYSAIEDADALATIEQPDGGVAVESFMKLAVTVEP